MAEEESIALAHELKDACEHFDVIQRSVAQLQQQSNRVCSSLANRQVLQAQRAEEPPFCHALLGCF